MAQSVLFNGKLSKLKLLPRNESLFKQRLKDLKNSFISLKFPKVSMPTQRFPRRCTLLKKKWNSHTNTAVAFCYIFSDVFQPQHTRTLSQQRKNVGERTKAMKIPSFIFRFSMSPAQEQRNLETRCGWENERKSVMNFHIALTHTHASRCEKKSFSLRKIQLEALIFTSRCGRALRSINGAFVS